MTSTAEETDSAAAPALDDNASADSDDDSLPPVVLQELAESTVRVLWNVTRSGANATNGALLREGAVAALLVYCQDNAPLVQVRAVLSTRHWKPAFVQPLFLMLLLYTHVRLVKCRSFWFRRRQRMHSEAGSGQTSSSY